ncbi:MAG: type II toxin-antitoxin system Phd/YefM family antitoxin [bacterium]|nr:type II toxin-antitoxin system Phd/YefM family antitoxin [bacterium]
MTSGPALTRTIPAGEFKAKCLKLMDEVNETGATIVITKRGRPVSRLVPVEREGRGISGILPEFGDFVDDPSETVIGPEDLRALEAGWDAGRSPSARLGA